MKQEYINALKTCPLLKDINETDFDVLVTFLNGIIKTYRKGQTIIHFGDSIYAVGIVLEGQVEGSFLNETFNEYSLARFTTGEMFGEALCLIEEQNSPVELKALVSTTILFVDIKPIVLRQTKNTFAFTLSKNLISILAKKNHYLNLKVRLLSQKSLRDRILMYISLLPQDKQGFRKIPFNITSLSSYLGVNRSALSRELGRMENEEIIIRSKDYIKIND